MVEPVFRLSGLLLAVGLSISFVEQLANRRHLGGDGVLSWRILRLARRAETAAPGGRDTLALVLDRPGILFVLALHGTALAMMVGSLAVGTFVPAVQGLLVATLLTLHFRNWYSLEGADQMMAIVAAAIFFHSLAPDDPLIARAALWFVALQAVLAYFAAGVGKLAAPLWRSGEGLRQIVNTETYGSPRMARLLHDRPLLARLLSWNVIGFQALFPAALLLGTTGAAVFLLWGLTFHAGSALVMGLHRFLWAFAAAYPAVWYCAGSI